MKKQYKPKLTGKFRYRKKYHLGEFSQYGVELRTLNPKIPVTDQFLDDFLKFIENMKLFYGGAVTSLGLEGIIETGTYKYHINNDHKDKITNWLKTYFETVEFSPYINLYYPERKVEYKGQ